MIGGPMADVILEATLRALLEADTIRAVSAVGRRGAFTLAVQYGDCERLLASTRGDVRLFSNLTTLAVFLRRLGVSRFEVDTKEYEPGRVRPARPDRAEALRRTRTKPRQGTFL